MELFTVYVLIALVMSGACFVATYEIIDRWRYSRVGKVREPLGFLCLCGLLWPGVLIYNLWWYSKYY